MNFYNIYILTLLLFLSAVNAQENNVEGLKITFKKVSEDYASSISAGWGTPSVPIDALEGMKLVKLQLTLKNEGQKDCRFDFYDVYLSTEKDSLYRFVTFLPSLRKTTVILKPNEEIKKKILFEFPDNATPNELFIEDKKYKVIEEK
jgi:hypothetical protein